MPLVFRTKQGRELGGKTSANYRDKHGVDKTSPPGFVA
jgi:hypothetical protein